MKLEKGSNPLLEKVGPLALLDRCCREMTLSIGRSEFEMVLVVLASADNRARSGEG
jgi:hypothetical protein